VRSAAATRAVDRYEALRPFAAVVAAPGDDPNQLVVAALSHATVTGALASTTTDDPLLPALIFQAAADQQGPRLPGRRRHEVRDASRYELELWELSTEERAVHYLTVVGGLEPHQIAPIVGRSSWAVRRIRRRVRRYPGMAGTTAGTALEVLAQRGAKLSPDELIDDLEAQAARDTPAVTIGRHAEPEAAPPEEKPSVWLAVAVAAVIAVFVILVALGSGAAL
jgi:DNA-directed RNA polymerase specialized sigma24 family protein